MIGLPFRVMTIDQNRAAVCCCASVDIAPAVADHKAEVQVDAPSLSGFLDHARLGLAAGALVGIAMVAGAKFVDRQLRGQRRVDGLDCLFGLLAARYVGLVRHHNQLEASLF